MDGQTENNDSIGFFARQGCPIIKVTLSFPEFIYTICLTIWYQLFVEFWLVHIWFFPHWRHQRAVTRLKNIHQLNER